MSLETKICELESAIASTPGRLDTQIPLFVEELIPAVEDWMRKEVARRIEEKAEMVNAGGEQAMRYLKKDLLELIERLPKICAAAVGSRETWPHNQTKVREKRGESFFASSFRSSINHLVPSAGNQSQL